ncbi:hypothetical protein D9758_011438 [Tetrapyrgos nigripes]|uniref:Uncharacterized protein n=1 Tax=Tetrapyrgos nigripes TaxID=182062 RepID=A0A8H5FQJ2_9AGAR|nr:hypothetical protein D9758_011438 [Tetrapyrgos nigripes]
MKTCKHSHYSIPHSLNRFIPLPTIMFYFVLSQTTEKMFKFLTAIFVLALSATTAVHAIPEDGLCVSIIGPVGTCNAF